MNGRRILVAGGMLLVCGGLLYALTELVLFSQSLADLWEINLELALNMAMKGQMEMARGYVRELAALEHRQLWHWLVAGHLTGSGLISLAVSSFIRALTLHRKWEKILSYLLILGGLLSAAGFFVQLLGYGFYGRGISLLGYIWQLAGLAGFIAALVLYMVAGPEAK